jgi:hypothetical protein
MTRADLERCRTPAGRYTRTTVEYLGLRWPPGPGWLAGRCGLLINRDVYEQAVAGASAGDEETAEG